VRRDGETIPITVKPRSTRAGVTVGAEGEITVRVHAPAAEGAANRECIAVLAGAIGVARSAVQIVRGEKSRRKQLAVAGLSAEEVRMRLRRAAEEGAR
jgi:uncharacterized protein (TIGR00251 family)